MVRAQQARELGGADDLFEEPLAGVVCHQPVAVLGERGRVERRRLDVHVEEPAEQQVVVELLAELTLAADAVEIDEQRVHDRSPEPLPVIENTSAIAGAVTAVVAWVKPFTDPVFEELGQHVANKVWLKGSAVRVARRAQERIEAAGEQPGQVAPKLLVSILEASSVETEDEMIEYWSGLLASASVTQKAMPSFPRILSELTAHEAQLLDAIWKSEVGNKRGAFQVRLDRLGPELGRTADEVVLMVENLVRLRLVRAFRRSSAPVMMENPPMDPDNAIALTGLGLAFIEACRGPALRESASGS